VSGKKGGECWNWFVGYRDPIANSPTRATGEVLATSIEGVLGGNWQVMVGIGALLLGAVSLIGKGKGR